MTDKRLTEKEAFLAMYSFLDEYCQITKADEIGALLGSMSLLADGGTADPAIEQDWKKAVEMVLAGSVDAKLDLSKE